jgi:cation:H+ antiporter
MFETTVYPSLLVSLLALVGGLLMLATGGEALVSGASKFALRHGMRPMVVGLTVVAFGTSMPELFVSLSAALQDHVDIMVGNVVGSNIANIGLVLALAALLQPLPVKFAKIRRDLYLVLFLSGVVMAIAWAGYFYRIFGLLFVGGLVWYTVHACRDTKFKEDGHSLQEELAERESNLKIIGLQGGGLLLLAYGSDLFIQGAVAVARYLGVSELAIGLTMAAIGTSMPELASSLAAVRRRQHELLIGNILGSNLFNLLLVMGTTALIHPFRLKGVLLTRDLPVMLAYSAALTGLLFFRQRLERWAALALLLGYGGYLFWVY